MRQEAPPYFVTVHGFYDDSLEEVELGVKKNVANLGAMLYIVFGLGLATACCV